jgi:hypothetical protein
MNLSVAQGVAVREFKLKHGHGYADYLLFVDGKAVGVLETKAPGHTLIGCLRPVQRRLRSAGGRHYRELHAIHAESWRGPSARSGGGWQAPAPRTIEFGTGPRCRIRGR